MLSMGREIDLLEMAQATLAQQMRDIFLCEIDPSKKDPGTMAEVATAFVLTGERIAKLKKEYTGR